MPRRLYQITLISTFHNRSQVGPTPVFAEYIPDNARIWVQGSRPMYEFGKKNFYMKQHGVNKAFHVVFFD